MNQSIATLQIEETFWKCLKNAANCLKMANNRWKCPIIAENAPKTAVNDPLWIQFSRNWWINRLRPFKWKKSLKIVFKWLTIAEKMANNRWKMSENVQKPLQIVWKCPIIAENAPKNQINSKKTFKMAVNNPLWIQFSHNWWINRWKNSFTGNRY